MDETLGSALRDPEARKSMRAILTVVFAHGILSSLPPNAEFNPDEAIRAAIAHADKLLESMDGF